MPLTTLAETLPGLEENLKRLSAVNQADPLWQLLRRLLLAHAPSGGANLLGGIGDDIAVLADGLGLNDRVIPHLGSTGNTAIWLGSGKETVDVVVVAHMDRPSFRVQDLSTGALFPICATRFTDGEHRVTAKAVRFDRGRLIVGASGLLIAESHDGQTDLRFEARRGTLQWHDTVLMDVNPVHSGGEVIGTGLDNSTGVLIALLTAVILFGIEAVLREREKRCLFVFTDQEEGPPDAFFGHGAARLRFAVRPPTYGCVIVDTQEANAAGQVPQPGGGICHATASKWGKGAIVPPNYHALAVHLAEQINAARPGTVQLNTGYVSRSDDVILGRWSRILGLIGPPLSEPHTGQERVTVGDLQAGVWWLAHFLAATLNLAPALTACYALG
jgi:putative aminopeptidase FrvX